MASTTATERRAIERKLGKVRTAARRAGDSRAAVDSAIREAREAGASLRDIGEAAGISHPTVMAILERGE